MSAWLWQAVLLAQQTAARSDTLLMRQVGQEQGWFQKVTGIASGLMTLAILVLTVALVPAAWNFRKSYKKVSDLLDRVYGDINPLMRHASTIADNVNFITTSARVDVQQVSATVAAANQRMVDAVRLAERRVREFNALLALVQEEAERAFVSTASTVRGFRTGAAAFSDDLATAGALDGELVEEELDDRAYEDGEDELDDKLDDDVDALDEELEASSDAGEREYGEQRTSPTRGQERPRIRPRRRSHRRAR